MSKLNLKIGERRIHGNFGLEIERAPNLADSNYPRQVLVYSDGYNLADGSLDPMVEPEDVEEQTPTFCAEFLDALCEMWLSIREDSNE